MSFRIKTTHQLLDTNTPPKQNDKSGLAFFETTTTGFTLPEKKEDNRPKDSNAKGMAVRVVNGAQADHM